MSQRLARDYEITLICRWVANPPPDLGDLPELTQSLHVIPAKTSAPFAASRLKAALCMISPLGVPYRRFDRRTREVSNRIVEHAEGHYDCALWVGLLHTMEPSLERIERSRLVLALIASASLHYRRSSEPDGLKKRLKIWKMRRCASSFSMMRAQGILSPASIRRNP